MAKHAVCPWWIGYLLASPVRKYFQDPVHILSSYVRAGMSVLEPGPGMGFFTLEIARLVGPSGRVVAVDAQPQMIEGLKRRARKAGLLDRIDARVARAESMALGDLDGAIDFTFAFAVVHEMPSAVHFFDEAARVMKPDASLLLAEPAGHVGESEFAQLLAAASEYGLQVIDRPSVSRCMAAVLSRKSS
jgi:ubiquinone/menaquinone biosynthesis C-methylase UbiE